MTKAFVYRLLFPLLGAITFGGCTDQSDAVTPTPLPTPLPGRWQVVGERQFAGASVQHLSLALDETGAPYVAHLDWGVGSGASAMKFDGSSWVQVGSRGFSHGTWSTSLLR